MFQLLARLVVFLVIISVIKRVAKIVIGFWAGLSEPKVRPSGFQNSPPPGAQHMSLVQDPVCGTYVALETSLKKIVKGKVVYFCSEECKDKYPA